SCKSASTGYAPFELNYGYMPRTMTLAHTTEALPGLRDFADRARQNLMDAHDAIIASRVFQTTQANRRRSDHPSIEVGTLVYLSTKN
ncbi:hypothetical protein K474DRAFT_1572047, partial [Panus rudis PR-1116 ss-1]